MVSDCKIDHFAVLCSVTRPLNKSNVGVDLALIQTSLLFLYMYVNHVVVILTTRKAMRFVAKTTALLLFKGLVTEHRTVTWSIGHIKIIKEPMLQHLFSLNYYLSLS